MIPLRVAADSFSIAPFSILLSLGRNQSAPLHVARTLQATADLEIFLNDDAAAIPMRQQHVFQLKHFALETCHVSREALALDRREPFLLLEVFDVLALLQSTPPRGHAIALSHAELPRRGVLLRAHRRRRFRHIRHTCHLVFCLSLVVFVCGCCWFCVLSC